MTIKVRPFQYDDAPQVTNLIKSFWKQTKVTNNFSKEVISDRNNFWSQESKIHELSQDPNRQIFVAIDPTSKQIKGTVTLLSENKKMG
ncbi:MAG: hypothetical protein JHC93_07385 [Parachlamydiales bacterium]|nr:hypothetical protein [Parachlamydiales bacterium]